MYLFLAKSKKVSSNRIRLYLVTHKTYLLIVLFSYKKKRLLVIMSQTRLNKFTIENHNRGKSGTI